MHQSVATSNLGKMISLMNFCFVYFFVKLQNLNLSMAALSSVIHLLLLVCGWRLALSVKPVGKLTFDKMVIDSGYRRKIEVLGSGTSCKAYEGFHKDRANRTVVVRTCKYVSKFDRKLLMEECELHKRLDHEKVVKLFDCFEGAEPFVVFILEHMAGGDLGHWILEKEISGESIPKQVIRKIFLELLEGIQYLHSNGVIHRDLKPDNILRDTKGSVKIGDLGIAEKLQYGSSVFTGCEGCGTHGYRAPEIDSGSHTLIADIYSLGVILFELATFSPFPEVYSVNRFVESLTDSLLEHGVDENLIQLIVGMTELDPTKRWTLEQIAGSSFVLEDIPLIEMQETDDSRLDGVGIVNYQSISSDGIS